MSTDRSADRDSNPFFAPSTLPLGMPHFDRIESRHFLPAFERGIEDHLREIEAIVSDPAPPTFENVFVAIERSGRLLRRVRTTFTNLAAAHTNDDLEAVRTEVSPRLAAHYDRIRLDPALFARIVAVHDRLDQLDLDAESRRLVERYHIDFVRAGATLGEEDRERLKAVHAELAELATRFTQNVRNEVNALAIVVDSAEELAGLTEHEIVAAARAADDRGLAGRHVIPLLNTSGQPVLASLDNRALRRRIHETSLSRGHRGSEHDNRAVLCRIVRLRAERARLLGYPNHAAFVLEEETAGSAEAVNERLAALAPPAVANARREAESLQRIVDAEGGDFAVAAWDWAYYTERLRRSELEIDESRVRPYLEMTRVLEDGVFYAAERLFGLSFRERTDLPAYHPDVRFYEILEGDELIGLFLTDFYARPSKRGGAWMNSYVTQSRLFDERPIITNHMNVRKPPPGEPTLLTFDEVTTMFHEFGHALHGLFSDVRYPYFAGTAVPRDFVEFPSQLNEMWATWPDVLENYAVHHRTGEPMPEALLDKIRALETFNQGFATTEYLAAALLDQALHQLGPDDVPDPEGLMDFESRVLREAGVDLEQVHPRYRCTYFSHIIGGYAAGYYSYIWSEVLDADAVVWFEENGGPLRDNGAHLRSTVLSRGGTAEPLEMYRDFRGRDAEVEPFLERRGLAGR